MSRFADVDADESWSPHVERLADYGVTKGCRVEVAQFCPDSAVTRAQMAAFLERALRLEAASPAGFTDTAGHPLAASIDALAARGITQGCAVEQALFCPDEPVTHGQMATFLARALKLIPLPPEVPFQTVAVGGAHGCGLRVDETVVCWGSGTSGRADAPDGRFTALAASRWSTCGVRADSSLACWGTRIGPDETVPDGQFSSVAVGIWHACAVRTDRTLRCWGYDNLDRTAAPQGQFQSVTVGDDHSCGLRVDGSVSCWGSDEQGQATAPDGLFTAVVAGDDHTCGLSATGTVVCWGDGRFGQTERARGAVQRRRRGFHPLVRSASRRHRLLLGAGPLRPVVSSRRTVQRPGGRRPALVRRAGGRSGRLLGQ